MGLQPREPHRLASRQARRSSNPDTTVNSSSSSSPKHSTSSAPRRVSVPPKSEDFHKLPHANLDPKLTRVRQPNMAASSPRRPARYSTGDVPNALRGAGGPPSPRRPARHSFSMSAAPQIKEEASDGEDEVDGASASPVFDITRLASSPKPPRKVHGARPMRHSVCVAPSDALAATRRVELLPASAKEAPDSYDDRNDAAAAALAADRKRKRVRFSVPDIRLTEEQLAEFAATANAAAQDRENQLAAPCSDIFRKTMLDMQFLSLEQRREEEEAGLNDSDTRSSSSPSNDS